MCQQIMSTNLSVNYVKKLCVDQLCVNKFYVTLLCQQIMSTNHVSKLFELKMPCPGEGHWFFKMPTMAESANYINKLCQCILCQQLMCPQILCHQIMCQPILCEQPLSATYVN